MANQETPLQPAIDELEKDLGEIERQGNILRTAINILRSKAGLPLLLDGGGSHDLPGDWAGTAPQVRHDTFFGKRMGTAAREYLEMEKARGGGPVKPRIIFEALKAGGFQFETKDDATAIVSVRNMLRKRTEVFQKLPPGTYGLTKWYPRTKTAKATGSDEPDQVGEQVPQDGTGEAGSAEESDTAANVA